MILAVVMWWGRIPRASGFDSTGRDSILYWSKASSPGRHGIVAGSCMAMTSFSVQYGARAGLAYDPYFVGGSQMMVHQLTK